MMAVPRAPGPAYLARLLHAQHVPYRQSEQKDQNARDDFLKRRGQENVAWHNGVSLYAVEATECNQSTKLHRVLKAFHRER
jgi:delta 1-pyrroline-5-carboxylate dehydrogenase